MFLGDLFDGGREWSTPHSSSPEKRYNQYGESFWHKEYRRFSGIFFDTWREAGVAGRPGQPNRRRIFTNVAGNHDLGFAAGIQDPVRRRFNAYFGDGNAVWIIGNHTIVSVDTVSLSAKEVREAPDTIWKPAQEFLDGYKDSLYRAMATHSAVDIGGHGTAPMDHQVVEGAELSSASLPKKVMKSFPSYPTVLLSHVPLYRDTGTPCGPLREKWPQSTDSDGKLSAYDERNAISVSRGYQYQNVLSPEISKEITTKLENVSYAFSGDDHDYCDVVHRRYPSGGDGIREITVKSISWAMGVRKPGFQLVSIWNPVDDNGQPLNSKAGASLPKNTLQSQMCLMPDQLGIFIQYALVFLMSLIFLGIRAAYLTANPKFSSIATASNSILPVSRSPGSYELVHGQSSSSDDGGDSLMTKRCRLTVETSSRTGSRNNSPKPSHGYGLPPSPSGAMAFASSKTEKHDWYIPGSTLLNSVRGTRTDFQSRSYRGFALFKQEFKWSFLKLSLIVFPWYGWLIYRG
jgi:hypothetical protein